MTNPLNTLTGRMVAVTIAAVIVSYAIAFAIYANERGSALRRAAETNVAERVVFTAERLREIPIERRASAASSLRDFSLRFSVSSQPQIGANLGGPGVRIANAISERLANSEAHAQSRIVDAPPRHWRGNRGLGDRGDGLRRDERRGPPPEGFGPRGSGPGPGDPGDGPDGGSDAPTVRVTEAIISVRLSDGSWLNTSARLPGPRPTPTSAIVGALASIIIVGIGAALVSGQIGRPLSDLANAARALGSGQPNVSAPVSGPEDVRRASTAFNVMAERLGRQLNRQRQMLWALSHDLRTPITAIRLRAELIEDEGERQRLLASVAEMETLTEQALSLARAGASEEARSNVDLAEIARTLCGELQDMGVNIRAEAAGSVACECRPSEIARAMRNLAENAAKYGGGGVMRVHRNEANEVVVEVLDEGPGVPPDLLTRLTSPFFRADEARSEASGAGLGLAITQAIADSHGGQLILENCSPKGFRASLILPG
ncbi:MAG: HAMP domain-containing sensor histidine kinase [Hyphomonadaceae bacterium]